MVPCSICGQDNPAHARFCLRCGSPLRAAGGTGHEERRLVTVLFCDLVGFTARSDHADPEDVKATLRPFHARLQQEIQRFGGVVDQFLGDGVLGVFGAPTAHEDDPERAVRAGLRIQEAIRELNAEDPSLQLTARVGIETGEAVVSFGPGPQLGGSVTGDVTNTASRLQTVAPPGGVVVGEQTHAATARLFEFEPLDPVSVKGKARPLAIWRPVAPRSRPSSEAQRRFRTPFLGRTDDLDRLETLLLRSIRDRTMSFAVVVGEAGVGKSRLVAELARRADGLPELIRWREGRPVPFGEGGAFAAFADVVKSEAGILDSDTASETLEKLTLAVDQATEDPAERAELLEGLRPLVGLGPGGGEGEPSIEATHGSTARQQAFAPWRRFLARLAGQGPLILVFEDLHAAAGPMLELVDHLAARLLGVPVLMLAVGRPELLASRPSWSERPAVTVLELPPLAPDATEQLVRVLLGGSGVGEETVAALIRRSEGVPLFAEEFVQMLREREGGGGEGEIPIPVSLRALVAARLDALPRDERTLLQDVSTVGRTFWSGAAAAVSGLDPARVATLLQGLVEREVVHRLPTSSVEGEQEFTFWHAVVQEVAYEQVPRRLRAGKHRAVGRWFERVAGDRVRDRAELLAYHFGRALELVRHAGDRTAEEELLEPTARYSLLAAERAFGLDASRAYVSYHRVLSLLPPGHELRGRALRGAGVAAATLGRFREAEELLGEALGVYRDLDDPVGRADVLVAMSRLRFDHGDMEAVDALLSAALGLLEDRPPGPTLVRAYARHAGHLLVGGDYEGSLARARRALGLARELGMAREEVLALNYVGAAKSSMGDREGVADLRAAIELGTARGLGIETAIAMNNLAQTLWFLEGPATALPVWEELVAFCEERSLGTMLTFAWSGRIDSLFDLGRWDRVLDLAREAEAWDREHGGTPLGMTARALAGWVALRRGDLDTARGLVEEILRRADRMGAAEYRTPAIVFAAEVALRSGEPAEAMRRLEEFERLSGSDDMYTQAMIPVVARLLVDLGEADRLERMMDELPAPESRRAELSMLTAGAVLEEARAEWEAAAADFRAAAEGWDGYGFVLERGLTLLGLARCLRALGEEDEAAGIAREAQTTFQALEARPLADRASAASIGELQLPAG